MIISKIKSSIAVKEQMLKNEVLLKNIQTAANQIIDSYKLGGKTLFCGNGGSAADAQHLAAELSGRFYFDRPPLNAEACHVNSSFVTAVGNDYSFDLIYARYVQAMGNKNDVLVAISTSGNSKNIYEACKAAKERGMTIIAFTGSTGGKLKDVADTLINIPSIDTPRIQEAHILVGHILCEIIEESLFGAAGKE